MISLVAEYLVLLLGIASVNTFPSKQIHRKQNQPATLDKPDVDEEEVLPREP